MKKVAIIGASYLQLPLVEKCKELGYYSICFAIPEGAVCKEVCDEFYPISIVEKDSILEICKELKIDAILTIASDVAVPTVNYVAEKLGLIGNPISSSSCTTNKIEMKHVFEKANLPTAKNALLTTENDLPIVSTFQFPLIIKPSDRSGSLGVTKVNSENEVIEAFQIAKKASFCGQVIVEEFITGSEISVETISNDGHHYFLAFTDKVTSGAPHFVELEHHQPSQLPKSVIEEIKTILLSAFDALGIKFGASHSELIITSDYRIYINEIGARMGGDFIGSNLVFLSTGYDFLKGVLDVCLGQFEKPQIINENHSGVLFLSNETDFGDRINTSHPAIKYFSIENKKSSQLAKSADRHGYFIYQNENKVSFNTIFK